MWILSRRNHFYGFLKTFKSVRIFLRYSTFIVPMLEFTFRISSINWVSLVSGNVKTFLFHKFPFFESMCRYYRYKSIRNLLLALIIALDKPRNSVEFRKGFCKYRFSDIFACFGKLLVTICTTNCFKSTRGVLVYWFSLSTLFVTLNKKSLAEKISEWNGKMPVLRNPEIILQFINFFQAFSNVIYSNCWAEMLQQSIWNRCIIIIFELSKYCHLNRL